MWRGVLTLCTGVLAICAVGCMSGPMLENPAIIRPDASVTVGNPVWITPGDYGRVFEQVISIVDDYFEISYANRYDGWIVTFPKVAPGFEQIWRPGSPDAYQRLYATLQSVRNRAEIRIDPANDGGFFVKVVIYRELEDLARPIRATAGAAAFRNDFTVERTFEVIDPAMFESNWVPMGRDTEMEQLILQRLKKCM